MGTTPISIAITEDHSELRLQAKIILESFGYKVALTAIHGQDLLDQLATLDSVPDICLLDINMPVLDGFTTARLLREQYPTIRILAFSVLTDHRQVETILACGAHGFLSKSSELQEWNEKLLQVMTA